MNAATRVRGCAIATGRGGQLLAAAAVQPAPAVLLEERPAPEWRGKLRSRRRIDLSPARGYLTSAVALMARRMADSRGERIDWSHRAPAGTDFYTDPEWNRLWNAEQRQAEALWRLTSAVQAEARRLL